VLYNKGDELSRTCSIGKLISKIQFRDIALAVNGGPQPSGMLSTADYKDGKALKSCHTEFVHIFGAAFFHI